MSRARIGSGQQRRLDDICRGVIREPHTDYEVVTQSITSLSRSLDTRLVLGGNSKLNSKGNEREAGIRRDCLLRSRFIGILCLFFVFYSLVHLKSPHFRTHATWSSILQLSNERSPLRRRVAGSVHGPFKSIIKSAGVEKTIAKPNHSTVLGSTVVVRWVTYVFCPL